MPDRVSGLDPAALRLVVITDDLRDGVDGLVERALSAERGGATMVQLRLKGLDARTLAAVGSALVAKLTVPLVVNDRVDVAVVCGAAGVHLGFDDIPVRVARRIAPSNFVIGASVGADAEVENGRGADYVGVGPVYATSSKIDAGTAIGVAELARLAALCGRPTVGIGGITAENARAVVDVGAEGVAVIRGVFGLPQPDRAASALRSAIGR